MLASFSSQHLESHLHDPGNPLYDSITKNDALVVRVGWGELPQPGAPPNRTASPAFEARDNLVGKRVDERKPIRFGAPDEDRPIAHASLEILLKTPSHIIGRAP